MIQKIRDDLKLAMKEKNVEKRDVLKMVLNKANALAKDEKIEIPTNDMVLNAIKKELKQIEDTIDILKKNTKEDTSLYKESVTKCEILKTYLPKQLNEEELTREIQSYIEENHIDTSNKGSIMKAIMPIFKNKAEGKLINQVISKLY